MILKQISPDNRYFLFKDSAKRQFKVYKIRDKSDRDIKISKNQRKAKKGMYKFKFQYTVDIFESKISCIH